MSKGPSSKSDLIVDQRQLLAGIREYFQTPAEMRGNVQSMKSLAEHLGCGVQDLHRAMSLNPEMGSDILQGVALAGAVQIPRVLYKLMEAIEAGSIKAAEIYLDFIRKTIQDERLMQMSSKASEDLTKVLEPSFVNSGVYAWITTLNRISLTHTWLILYMMNCSTKST